MKTIVRYTKNRKMYLKEESRYVNLPEIEKLVQNNEVSIIEHGTDRDITFSILLQVLVKKEERLERFDKIEKLEELLRDPLKSMLD